VGTQRAELCEKDRGTQLQAQLGVQVQKLRNLRDKPRNLALATSANRFDCLYSKTHQGVVHRMPSGKRNSFHRIDLVAILQENQSNAQNPAEDCSNQIFCTYHYSMVQLAHRLGSSRTLVARSARD
jgi:hypothetical protein